MKPRWSSICAASVAAAGFWLTSSAWAEPGPAELETEFEIDVPPLDDEDEQEFEGVDTVSAASDESAEDCAQVLVGPASTGWEQGLGEYLATLAEKKCSNDLPAHVVEAPTSSEALWESFATALEDGRDAIDVLTNFDAHGPVELALDVAFALADEEPEAQTAVLRVEVWDDPTACEHCRIAGRWSAQPTGAEATAASDVAEALDVIDLAEFPEAPDGLEEADGAGDAAPAELPPQTYLFERLLRPEDTDRNVPVATSQPVTEAAATLPIDQQATEPD